MAKKDSAKQQNSASVAIATRFAGRKPKHVSSGGGKANIYAVAARLSRIRPQQAEVIAEVQGLGNRVITEGLLIGLGVLGHLSEEQVTSAISDFDEGYFDEGAAEDLVRRAAKRAEKEANG